jgi:ABC-type glycerol-3-phosphate transport system substrate-binding protein
MKGMTNFQIILLGFFIFFILVGVVLFAGFGGGNQNIVGNVVIWGDIDDIVMNTFLSQLRNENDSFRGVSYKEINTDSFDTELSEALASGTGPDVFLLSQDSILKHENKIFPIPYETLSLRDFKDKFIEEGELFLTSEGILGVPFTIDPLVMYWNRDIFSKSGVANPPKNWEEFFSLVGDITDVDENLNIFTSTVSFGEYRNVSNAKEIISFLVIQSGSPIVVRDTEGKAQVVFSNDFNSSIPPAEQAVNFFTQFSNPVKTTYTWNRALPQSETAFLSGSLALYFGFSSELPSLRRKNPNLNFDVVSVPQTEKENNRTFGKMKALVLAKNSQNLASAFNVINIMTADDSFVKLVELTNLPPVSRNLLSQRPTNPYMEVFYKSALLSQAWLDPNPQETDLIFKEMVESIVSGKERVSFAVDRAGDEIRELLR